MKSSIHTEARAPTVRLDLATRRVDAGKVISRCYTSGNCEGFPHPGHVNQAVS
jgi:hypothetical protein